MTRRTLYISFALLVAILLAAIAVVVANIDSYLDRQRPWLEQEASALLGRKVEADRIGLLLWPGIGIEVDGLRIGEDPAWGDGDFLRAKSLEVQVGIREAWRGEVRVRVARLVDPIATIHHGPDGLSVETIGRKPDAPPPPSDSGEASSPIEIELLEIWGGTLHYHDARGASPYTVSLRNFELLTRDWTVGQTLEFEARAILTGGDAHDTLVKASFEPTDEGPTKLDADVKLVAYDSAALVALEPIARQMPKELAVSGALHGDAKVEGHASDLRFQAKVDIADVALKTATIDKDAGQPFELAVTGRLDDAAVQFDEIRLSALKLLLSGTAHLTRADVPVLKFDARSDSIPLAALGFASPDATQAETVDAFEGSGKISLGERTRGTVTLRSGKGQARGIGWQQLAIDTNLGSPHRVQIRSGSASVAGVDFANAAMDVTASDDRIDLSNGVAEVLGGRLVASGHTETDRPERASVLSFALHDASAKRLDKTFRPNAVQWFEGAIDARLHVQGLGSTWEEIKRTVDGTGQISIANGVLRNVNLARGAVDAILNVPVLSAVFTQGIRASSPDVFTSKDTQFEAIVANLRVADGKVSTDQVHLVASSYKIVGETSMSLEGEIDARAVLTFTEKFTRKLGGSGKLVAGILNPSGLLAIPIRIRGVPGDIHTTADPTYVARALRDGLIGETVGGVVGGVGRVFDALKGAATKKPSEPAPQRAPEPTNEE